MLVDETIIPAINAYTTSINIFYECTFTLILLEVLLMREEEFTYNRTEQSLTRFKIQTGNGNYFDHVNIEMCDMPVIKTIITKRGEGESHANNL